MPNTRTPVADPSLVLAMIRADERDSLAALPSPPSDTAYAYTLIPLSRTIYACIETPPTRHQQFIIHTRWKAPELTPEYHSVFVKTRSPRYYRQVVENRPGLFGVSAPTRASPP